MSGCANQAGKNSELTYKKFYYSNNVLKKEGYFNSKMRPVDTLKSYTEDGKLKSTEVYDSSGKLNGLSTYYYPSGEVVKRKSFQNDILDGLVVDYYKSGKTMSVIHAKSGFYVGDKIHFFENGKYEAYNFLDFYGHNLIYWRYDSASQKRIEQNGNQLLVDSIVYYKDSIYLSFLLAHPPFTKNDIHIDELSDAKKTLGSQNIPDTSFLFNITFLHKPALKSVVLRISQYDSLTGKSNEINNLYNFHD